MSGLNPTPSDTPFTAGYWLTLAVAGAVTLASAVAARAMAEASQVGPLAWEIGRTFGPEVARLFGVTPFVAVLCAGSAVMS